MSERVVAGIESAVRSVASFAEQLRAADVRVRAAEKNAEAAEATYQAGRNTLRDVLEAQTRLKEARQAQVAAEVEELKAQVDLEVLRGILLSTLGVELL